MDPVKLELTEARDSSVSWLNTIALFAIVNSALIFLNINVNFVFGLGFADIFAYFTAASESSGLQVASVGVTMVCAFIFYKLGVKAKKGANCCLLYTSPSPRDGLLSRMPSSA